MFPLDVTAEVYTAGDPSLIDSSWTNVGVSSGGSKRGMSKTSSSQHQPLIQQQQQHQQHSHQQHGQHHSHSQLLTVPGSTHSRHDGKKEQTQLSPVKKRVKESTPPSGKSLPPHRSLDSRGSTGMSQVRKKSVKKIVGQEKSGINMQSQ